ncbi:hypothetical protein ACFQ1E_10570 [Sphingomonas canadensis]|uniref:Uncharacterized protein n=1 Tax=Sphingomonas canadensis TaxID=1219257 RepID=A0ABW3H5K2_9SPHN|nr:hypothetical protein [Sphingomonas canadensis]MCW3836438.1 hypothetical protein [Sphingomonas canadensis]
MEILAPLGSKVSKSGDTFPIRLAEPILVGGREIIPAGVTGMGEVVHAKKNGGGGGAGELVLAARYLDIGARRLRLRSLRLTEVGESRINTVNAMNLASAASPLPVALIGFLIKGGEVTVPAGRVAEAKTAEAFVLPLPTPVAVAPPVPAAGNAPENTSSVEGNANEVP